MEEARVYSSLPDCQTWSSTERLPLSSPLEETVEWGVMEELVNKADREEVDNSHPTGRTSEGPEEHWDPMTAPVFSMTCSGVPLNFATVQWDVPDPSPETPSPITDNSSADELDSSGAASLDWTLSPLSHQQHPSCVTVTELSVKGKNLKQNEPEQPLHLKTDQCESSHQTCDPPNPEVKERGPHTDCKEASASSEDHGDSLLVTPGWPEPEKEMGQPVMEEIIRPSDRTPSPVQTDGSESGLDSLATGLVEEWEQAGTAQINSEQRCCSTDCEEEEEEEEVVRETVTNLDYDGDKLQTDQSDSENKSEIIGQLTHPSETTELKQQSDLSEKSTFNGQSEPNHTDLKECNSTETVEQPQESERHADQVGHSHQPGEENHPTDMAVMQQAEQSDNIEQSEQLEESERTEQSTQTECLQSKQLQRQEMHIEQTKCLMHIEQTEGLMHIEQTECLMHIEQTEGLMQVEQTKCLMQTEQTECLMQVEQTEPSHQTEHFNDSEQSKQSEQDTEQSKQSEQDTEQSEQSVQTKSKPVHSKQLEELLFLCTEELKQTEQPIDNRQYLKQSETNQVAQPAHTELTKVDKHTQDSKQVEQLEPKDDLGLTHRGGTPEQPTAPVQRSETRDPAGVHMNGGVLDRERVCRLAERLYRLDGINKTDVVKHLDKDNDFSQAVGEEYLKFFDFTGQSLDQGLRSFLRVVVLIGETQERERVLQHFSCRFQQCNPETFSSSGEVLTLTCAVMLLNSDLHGQNVGKAMSLSSFLSNLDGMNEGENFSKELLKALYNSIKNEPLQWAVNDKELKSSLLLPEDGKDDAPLRSKSNPFQDVPHDKKATVFKQGFLQRKAHADIDGKRTPWGKRSWKTFYAVLKGMVLYLQKDEYKMEWQSIEEVVSVHHALAERAAEYTKRPHVFRLQTADWRVFLFQASSMAEMSSWISRINLVSALHSSPPFPAAVGSQRKFCRPILPASQSEHTLEQQLQSHISMRESFQEDLAYLQQSLREGRKAKSKELEEHRVKDEYLQHEKCRYETYIQMLEAWKDLSQSADTEVDTSKLNLFDEAVCTGTVEQEEEEGALKKSHSSPSLVLEVASPPVVKVKRNVSERRTYRKIVIVRRNQDI
uniref:PH and SEC7 domain-containing protein 4-like n=1 Tax=Esox lucius TaxID=8010 RepID=A0A6Q2ZL23_ESOLU